MKRRWIVAVAVSLAVSIIGCGGKEKRGIDPIETAGAENVTDTAASAEVKEQKKNPDEALGGVYLNGGSIAEIKMGICYEGVQTNFCTVKMPTEYNFSAIYIDENGQENSVPGTGSSFLQEAMNKGVIEESENAFSYIYLLSYAEDCSALSFRITTPDLKTMDELKAYAPGGVEFGTDEHPAYYYVDPDEYAGTDLSVGYQINDSILLSMTYQGPLAEELGLEQLAQNMYDLVEVIN